ncbi:MAG: hypothetical protein ACJAY1_001164, partial [Glaciecola sp.]
HQLVFPKQSLVCSQFANATNHCQWERQNHRL